MKFTLDNVFNHPLNVLYLPTDKSLVCRTPGSTSNIRKQIATHKNVTIF